MIQIDGTTARKKARAGYKKALQALDRARHELQRFEAEDKPAFDRWFRRQFGPLIAEIRTLGEKLTAQRQFLFEIEDEVRSANSSYGRAYERVKRRREQPPETRTKEEPPPEPPPNFGEFEDDPFKKFKSQFEDEFGRGLWEPPLNQPTQNPESAQRVKQLYRAIVRKLHPDRQQSLTPQQKEWWHQAQEAYRAADVEQLQVILTLAEIEEKGAESETSVSLLHRITLQFKNSLRELKRQLRDFRNDPAWNFSKVTDFSRLAIDMERMLRSEIFAAQQALNVVTQQLEVWARQAEMARSRRPRTRRSPSNHPEFF